MEDRSAKKNLFLIIIICVVITLGFLASIILKKYSTHKTISRLNAGYKVLSTVNTYFIPGKNAVLAGNPVEERGLYKVDLTRITLRSRFILQKTARY
jgi:hypothetical protein